MTSLLLYYITSIQSIVIKIPCRKAGDGVSGVFVIAIAAQGVAVVFVKDTYKIVADVAVPAYVIV